MYYLVLKNLIQTKKLRAKCTELYLFFVLNNVIAYIRKTNKLKQNRHQERSEDIFHKNWPSNCHTIFFIYMMHFHKNSPVSKNYWIFYCILLNPDICITYLSGICTKYSTTNSTRYFSITFGADVLTVTKD